MYLIIKGRWGWNLRREQWLQGSWQGICQAWNPADIPLATVAHDSAESHHNPGYLPDLLHSPVQEPKEASSWNQKIMELYRLGDESLQTEVTQQSVFTCLNFPLGLFRDSSSAMYPGLCLMDGSCSSSYSFPHFSATFQTVLSCLILLLNEVFLLLSYQYGEPFLYFKFLVFWRLEFTSHYCTLP